MDNLGLITSKAHNYKIWKEGIIKHNNKEFAFKPAENKTQSIKNKKELIKFINDAYNIHDSGKKRKLTLTQFLTLHKLNK